MKHRERIVEFASELVRMLSVVDFAIVDAISRRFEELSRDDVTELLLSLRFDFTIADINQLDRGVDLATIIASGVIAAPTTLFKEFGNGPYRGKRVEATLMSDGRIEFRGAIYNALSAAGIAAQEHVTGKRPSSCDGWWYWSCLGSDGGVRRLQSARQEYWVHQARLNSH